MTSVLTFILLVVLAGGVGLLVVSLAESKKPTADAPTSPRAGDEADTRPPPASGRHRAPPGVSGVPQNGAEGGPAAVVGAETAWELVPAGASGVDDPLPELPRRRRTSEPVPRSQIALEGRFADVARVPVWRRLLAVIGIVGITVLAGVVIAAVLAAAIGAAAELLNAAIG